MEWIRREHTYPAVGGREGAHMIAHDFNRGDNPMNTAIVLTVDLEDWRTALIHDKPEEYLDDPGVDKEFITMASNIILAKLDASSAKATFFVIGSVLREMPDLVAAISERGHEIAYHSPFHVPLSCIPRGNIESLIKRDVAIIERVTGQKPIGFRAPYFSITRRDGWILEILKRTGFKYDSSIVPSWTPLYGIPSAPRAIYRPSARDVALHDPRGPIIEVPVSVWPSTNLIPGIPLGGFFIRMLPEKVLNHAVRRTLELGRRPVVYFHPGDMDRAKVRIEMSPINKLVQYIGLGRGERNIDSILCSFKTNTIRHYLSEELGCREED